MIFFKLSFGYFSKLFYVLFIVLNEVHRKNSQISRSLINFQGRILIFKEFQMPLQLNFKFQYFSRHLQSSTNNIDFEC